MIKEWIEYLRSDAPSWARERGLIYESVALQARHGRLRPFWASHIEQTQDAISGFLYRHKFVKNLMVLGSGPLLDFPKELVNENRISLTLVDAVHPAAVKKWAQKHHFQMLNVDLSEPSDKVSMQLAPALKSVDAIVSLNLMSQLPLSRARAGDDAMICAVEHLKFLLETQKPLLLISDYLRIRQDRSGKTLDSRPTIPVLARPLRHWSWSLAPIGEISRSYSVELEVGVWTNKQLQIYKDETNLAKLFSGKVSQLRFADEIEI